MEFTVLAHLKALYLSGWVRISLSFGTSIMCCFLLLTLGGSPRGRKVGPLNRIVGPNKNMVRHGIL